LMDQLENGKILNAETINGDVSGANGYQVGVALGALKTALPLQSGPTPPPTSNVFLTTGVDNPTQGFSTSATGTPLLNGFVATQNNTTFNGTVGQGGTWTAGDQVTAVAGTTGQTFKLVGIGAPGAINVTSVGPGNKVSNIQTVNITAALDAMGVPTQAIQGDFTAAGPETEWTGLALLNVVKSASTATAADNLTVGPAVAGQVTDNVISPPPLLPT